MVKIELKYFKAICTNWLMTERVKCLVTSYLATPSTIYSCCVPWCKTYRKRPIVFQLTNLSTADKLAAIKDGGWKRVCVVGYSFYRVLQCIGWTTAQILELAKIVGVESSFLRLLFLTCFVSLKLLAIAL